MPRRVRQIRFAVLVLAMGAAAGFAQEPPRPGKEKDAAVKLPDGTIVFYTKAPDDPNPPIDGVRLSAKEYAALVEQADFGKKWRDGARPLNPSECHISGRSVTRGDRTVAELTVTYRFRTTGPLQTVALGGGRTFPVGAKIDGDGLPVLVSADDGFLVVVEKAGDHVLSLTAETAVTSRGTAGATGFDFGLPRAAITSFVYASPFPPGTKENRIAVTVRGGDPTGRPGESQRTSYEADTLARIPVPLGAAEHVDVAWTAPAAGAGPHTNAGAVESDITVRVEDTLVETTARIRLKGATSRTWELLVPPGTLVSVDRTTPAKAGDTQSTAAKREEKGGRAVWAIDLPDSAEWTVTAVIRTARPKPNAPDFTGPYPVGPFYVRNALSQTGTVRIHAPPHVRLDVRHGSELRRADPATGESAAFQFFACPVGPGDTFPPLLSVSTHPATGVVHLKPSYRLRLTPAGWRVHADLHVTPVRTAVAHLRIEYPPDWPLADVGPADLADGTVADPPGPRRGTTVRFNPPRHDPFDLTLDVLLPVSAGARSAALSLPQFPGTLIRESLVAALVPNGSEIRGTVQFDGAGPATDLIPTSGEPVTRPTASVTSGPVPGSPAKVELHWQPLRHAVTADIHTDVTIQDRQYVVNETVAFHSAEPITLPVRFRGPAHVVGLRSQPVVSLAGAGEWTLPPPSDRSKELTLTLTYAVPIRDPSTRLPIQLIWPDDVTQSEAAVRIWSGPDRKIGPFEGQWRASPLQVSPNRDSLPTLTLKATRGPDDAPPGLVIDTVESDGGPGRVVIDRALFQSWYSDDGTGSVRARFVLSRWPESGIDLETPPDSRLLEVWIDGKRWDPATRAPSSMRIPLPESKPGRPVLILDVRLDAAPSGFGNTLAAPGLRTGVYLTAPVWQVIPPVRTVMLNFGGDWTEDVRWTWRGGRPVPAPVGSTIDLDRWVSDGTDPQQPTDEPGRIVRTSNVGLPVRCFFVPHTVWTGACSLGVLAAGYALYRRKSRLGLSLVGVGIVCIVAYFWFPQPAVQFLYAGQPGLAGLALIGVGQAAVRGYYRQRVTNLPGFSRRPAGSGGDGSSADSAVAPSAPVAVP